MRVDTVDALEDDEGRIERNAYRESSAAVRESIVTETTVVMAIALLMVSMIGHGKDP
jgi:hypothetical protein